MAYIDKKVVGQIIGYRDKKEVRNCTDITEITEFEIITDTKITNITKITLLFL